MAKPKGKQHQITAYFIYRMRRRMEERRMTSDQLAERLNADQSAVRRILSGASKTSGLLPRIREILGIPADEQEDDYLEYEADLIDLCALTMAVAPLQMREFMADIEAMSKLYRESARATHDRITAEGQLSRLVDEGNEELMTELLAGLDQLRRKEAELHRTLRKISQHLDPFA